MSEVLQASVDSDVKRITSLVTHSFRLSRGKAALQQQMLLYAGAVLGDSIPASAYDEAVEPTIVTCKTIFSSPRHHLPIKSSFYSEEQFDRENRYEICRFVDILKDSALNHDRYAEFDLPRLIIGDLIAADSKWLPWARDASNKPQALRSYQSNTANYSILGKNTGVPIFNQLYQVVAETLPSFLKDEASDNQDYAVAFRNVMRGHIDINPQDETAIRDFVVQNNLPSL